MSFARWKIIVVGCVILALSSTETFARGAGGPAGGGARGGEGGGGAARGGAGGARGGAGGGAGEGREGGQRGGAGGGEGRGGAGGGAQRGGAPGGGNANRSPSFSSPGGGGGRGAGEGAGAGNRSNSATGAGNRKNPNSQSANQTRTGTGNSVPSGNTVNTGNTVNAASTGYHPNGANHGAYNGSWNDHGAYGAAAYAARPAAWGMESRDMAAMAYGSGYSAYSNPYAGAAGGSSGGGGGSPVTNVYNYAQPVPPANNSAAAPSNNAADSPTATAAAAPASPPAPGQDSLDPAIAAFKENDYDQALNLVNNAIAQAPHDAVMHEFRGLVLFAKPDYKQAAATIHGTLALGPGWDWTTLCSMYSNIDLYTDQLRALEKYVREHSQDGAGHFLLAYHYLVAGHSDVAAQQLKEVVKLVPGDALAAQMLKMVSSPGDQPAPPTPDSDQAPAKPIDPMMFVGNWKATREGDAKFELTLTPDATFNWKFTQQGKTTEFGGKYSVDGNVLDLERSDGGSLVAETNFDGARKFKFKLVGAPGTDPGLTFGR